MSNRRELLMDTAISLLGERGVHGLTHRAVDTEAGLPSGSAANYFSTRDALLDAVVERVADRERDNWEQLWAARCPTTPAELAEVLAAFAHQATGPHRTLTLARYAVLVEAAHRPQLRPQLAAVGGRVRAYFLTWMRVAGSTDLERDAPIIMNCWTGLVLHQLSYPNPEFDPLAQLGPLVAALLPAPHGKRGSHGT
ncbi:TetR/AcrR family transcriptional regulator [Catellatospora paridis]|uniref:TetR/AcrR family transcriptional regulator n=1 Tax=Catellatospora paridis TaxID=1617086 RepID=UPI0012D3FAEF|nr:TetR/AcrR family transcriptional regulator [Catellatospora paridis]